MIPPVSSNWWSLSTRAERMIASWKIEAIDVVLTH